MAISNLWEFTGKLNDFLLEYGKENKINTEEMWQNISDLFAFAKDFFEQDGGPDESRTALRSDINLFLQILSDSAETVQEKTPTSIKPREIKELQFFIESNFSERIRLEAFLKSVDDYFGKEDLRHNNMHRYERLVHFREIWEIAATDTADNSGNKELFNQKKAKAPKVEVLGRDMGSYGREYASKLDYDILHRFRKHKEIKELIKKIEKKEDAISKIISSEADIMLSRFTDYFKSVEKGDVKISVQEFSKRVEWVDGLIRALKNSTSDEQSRNIFMQYKKDTSKMQFGVNSAFSQYVGELDAKYIPFLIENKGLETMQILAHKADDKLRGNIQSQEDSVARRAVLDTRKTIEALKDEVSQAMQLGNADLAKYPINDLEQKIAKLNQWMSTPDSDRQTAAQGQHTMYRQSIITPEMHKYGSKISKDRDVGELMKKVIESFEQLQQKVTNAKQAVTTTTHDDIEVGPQAKGQWRNDNGL